VRRRGRRARAAARCRPCRCRRAPRGQRGARPRRGRGRRRGKHGDVGRLVVVDILARRLAERRRRLGHVEDVVDDLEGEADRVAVLGERLPLARVRRAAGGAHQDAGAQEGAGLPAVHVGERALVKLAADARQVDRLAAGHAAAARGARQQRAQARLQCRGDAVVGGRQDLERERLHGVAGKHRLGHPEADVHRRLAAAQDIVVHARQVVVDQRVGVDELDRAGCAQRRRTHAVDRIGRGEHEQRTQSLSAVEDGIAHGVAEAGWCIGRNASVERRLDRIELGEGPGVERVALHVVGHGRSWPSSSTFTCCSTASRRERQYCSSSVPRR